MSTARDLLRRTATWHRPMMVLAATMAVMTVVSIGGLVFDDRVLIGAPIWLKPFKFAVSIGIYGLTWGWMVSLLPRRKWANRLSTGIVAILFLEYALLLVQAVRGHAMHFNVANSFDATLWVIMGSSIAVLWVFTLILTALMFRAKIADAASRWAIRLGGLISVIGLGLGQLMTSPTAQQMARMKSGAAPDFIGAHSVGVEDGGPIMPITGWSSTGGDLRIPHFVGMHALQVLPLFVLLLGVLATRIPRLRSDIARLRLVFVASGFYAGLTGLVTWQALRGQSLIHPDGLTWLALAGLTGLAVIGGLWAVSTPADDRDLVAA
ncbi:hypothetical protein AB5J62_03595 [Amycolatopsis sp. cg5]|uniref:hypothetical protein n=1 Tax=Amycolatopsis sp. cg5 TaxID=3238802 RepID=UPI003523EE3F